MIDRGAVADVLEEIGLLLELMGDNPFKSRAYSGGARIVRGLDVELPELIATKKLSGVKGIGPALAGKIATLVTTGKLPYLDDLRAQVPSGLLDWLRVPGLGPKKARLIHLTLGIATLEELEEAAREGRLRVLEGLGEATEKRILEGIAKVRTHAGSFLRPVVLAEARRLLDVVSAAPGVVRAEVVGPVRRATETSRSVDLLAAAAAPSQVLDAFASAPGVAEVIDRTESACSARLAAGPDASLEVVVPERFAAALVRLTGSAAHVVGLSARGIDLDGVFADEGAVYASGGLAVVPPELREARGEIEAAAAGSLPTLLELPDLRGILHCHSTWSDGRDSIERMAEAARAMGMTYLGLCDHSRSAAYAGGLSIERVREQHVEIDRINRAFGGAFRVLKGIEVDILADGALDFPDEVLSAFELVVASVHSRFNLSAQEQTARMIRAVASPYVDIVGHPTGRILLARDPYPLDLAAVVRAAAERGVAVEVNAHPNRLDLDAVSLRSGLALGVMTSIDPDAHSIEELGHVRYGVEVARRGWATRADVLNALPLDDLLAWLSARRARAIA